MISIETFGSLAGLVVIVAFLAYWIGYYRGQHAARIEFLPERFNYQQAFSRLKQAKCWLDKIAAELGQINEVGAAGAKVLNLASREIADVLAEAELRPSPKES